MPQQCYTPMEMIPLWTSTAPTPLVLRCTHIPQEMDLGVLRVTPTRCLSHCKRMAWGHLARSSGGNFQDDK